MSSRENETIDCETFDKERAEIKMKKMFNKALNPVKSFDLLRTAAKKLSGKKSALIREQRAKWGKNVRAYENI